MEIKVVSGSPAGHKELADQVLKGLKRRAQVMGLGEWSFDVRWEGVENGFCMATEARPEYYKAILTVDLGSLEAKDIDAYIVHELLHVHLWFYTYTAITLVGEEQSPILLKLEERAVSDLERMPVWG